MALVRDGFTSGNGIKIGHYPAVRLCKSEQDLLALEQEISTPYLHHVMQLVAKENDTLQVCGSAYSHSHQPTNKMNSSTIYEEVQKRYSSCAQEESGGYATSVAKAFGYSEEELKSIPKDANLGLSCGNPVALANLHEVPRFPSHTHYALIVNLS